MRLRCQNTTEFAFEANAGETLMKDSERNTVCVRQCHNVYSSHTYVLLPSVVGHWLSTFVAPVVLDC